MICVNIVECTKIAPLREKHSMYGARQQNSQSRS